MKGTVILPCLNEGNTVKNIIKEIKLVSKQLNIELFIIAINDASTDNSATKLKDADKIIEIKKRISLANVIKLGLQESKKINPDFIIHIDADGQHNPKYIPDLIKPILDKKADFVIGSRYLNNTNNKNLKYYANKIFTRFVNLITKLNLTDSQSGFRALSKKVFKNMNLISNYTYTHEEILFAKKNKLKILEIPIKVKPRKFGKSKIC